MENELTVTRSGTISRNLVPRITPQDAALAQMVVKVRQVQGWNLQTPKDAKLMASAWKEQLDRYGVSYKLYDKLVDLSVDHRKRQILAGMQPTALTVELMLACFERYRADAFGKRRDLQTTLNNACQVVERVRSGYLPKEVGHAALLSVGTESDDDVEDFEELAGRIIERLQQKVDGFLKEYYLEEDE
jgi:hypothetical protein